MREFKGPNKKYDHCLIYSLLGYNRIQGETVPEIFKF